ncbi:regulatory protein, tetR family [Paramicrobacterium humi]|uniref:Regulatory protein, tetR family n=1 Tax=Paramicrobacterium humi TaxID=640635 RepID=A0A1H4QXF1_9MICO|nr:TetR/AcrR family transcriptional regulator [Microbacterium humi]SEC24305.1 regulatory protein, tetR family [Microbacterium humi]
MNVDSLTNFLTIEYADASLLRNSPQQNRSRQSLETILQVCGQLIDESGHAGVTTAEVAKRADIAIGTVYRFFPDRIALMLGVYDYMLARYVQIALDAFAEKPAETWQGAFATLVESTVVARRTIPGYKATHYRILADDENQGKYQERTRAYVDAVVGLLSQYEGVPSGEAWWARVGVAIELSRTLQRLAFDDSPEGDPGLLEEAVRVPVDYLSSHSADA